MQTSSDDVVKQYIRDFKKRYKDRLIIPAHHYVNSSVIEFADFTGDSYKLAVECAASNAEWIVFCGVSFMAEGVEILKKENQKVLIPEPAAGCPMADMIDRDIGLKALKTIKDFSGSYPAPIVYMNSYADSKSLCGEFGGTVCTSANAEKIMNYYLNQDKNLFFFPDKNLGINTAYSIGLTDNEIALITRDFQVVHNSKPEKIKLYLWDGMCPVHHQFKTEDIKSFREKYPKGKVIVHPEVQPEVAALADLQGSTQRIYDLVSTSAPGSIWCIGTEDKFVRRLGTMFKDKIIVPINANICKNMSKTTINNLMNSLSSIDAFEKKKGLLKYPVNVQKDYRLNAKIAFDTMISIVEM